MKTRDQALSIAQASQRIRTSLKSDVQVQVAGLRNMLLQHRERHIVAGLHGKQLVALIPGIGDDARQVRA